MFEFQQRNIKGRELIQIKRKELLTEKYLKLEEQTKSYTLFYNLKEEEYFSPGFKTIISNEEFFSKDLKTKEENSFKVSYMNIDNICLYKTLFQFGHILPLISVKSTLYYKDEQLLKYIFTYDNLKKVYING